MALTVRVSKSEQEDVDKLKKLLGVKSAASALLKGANMLPQLVKKNEALEKELSQTRAKLNTLIDAVKQQDRASKTIERLVYPRRKTGDKTESED